MWILAAFGVVLPYGKSHRYPAHRIRSRRPVSAMALTDDFIP
ncbi:hypothetical protein CU044_2218 [Streptomyces sp. L-9-10]|nr:hypothetical protein CU044_2218 [Streptomyces sp. L-9-10]